MTSKDIDPLFVSNDAAAAKICGFGDRKTFREWAVSRGLKPPIKANRYVRDCYEIARLTAERRKDTFASPTP